MNARLEFREGLQPVLRAISEVQPVFDLQDALAGHEAAELRVGRPRQHRVGADRIRVTLVVAEVAAVMIARTIPVVYGMTDRAGLAGVRGRHLHDLHAAARALEREFLSNGYT